jgi:hypothetical protein
MTWGTFHLTFLTCKFFNRGEYGAIFFTVVNIGEIKHLTSCGLVKFFNAISENVFDKHFFRKSAGFSCFDAFLT